MDDNKHNYTISFDVESNERYFTIEVLSNNDDHVYYKK